jgi:hypothetical protein
VVSWVWVSCTRLARLTGDLPYDEGAEERIAKDQQGSNPFCMSWIDEHVVGEVFGCQCHGEVVDGRTFKVAGAGSAYTHYNWVPRVDFSRAYSVVLSNFFQNGFLC